MRTMDENLNKFVSQFGPPAPLPQPPNQRRPTIQEIYENFKLPEELYSGTYANSVLVGHGPASSSWISSPASTRPRPSPVGSILRPSRLHESSTRFDCPTSNISENIPARTGRLKGRRVEEFRVRAPGLHATLCLPASTS